MNHDLKWEEFAATNAAVLPFVSVSCGTNDHDFHKVGSVLDRVPQIPFVCLDVANGYTEIFVEHVRRVREAHPSKIIIAGESSLARSTSYSYNSFIVFSLSYPYLKGTWSPAR
jgi:hypothetical protein